MKRIPSFQCLALLCKHFDVRSIGNIFRPSFKMSSFDMLNNLAYIKSVSTTDFFVVKLEIKSCKMDLFAIRIRLGISRSHSLKDK